MKHKPATIYSGKVGAKMNALPGPKTTKRIFKEAHFLCGGPMHGYQLYLESPVTLVFKMGGHTGRYVAGHWEAVCA